ncbi:uncharacterized protein LOC135484856 [Lineus longissimus]|uniref:uncharacterized protein LOC135484856 n=1 Tax=Lineus longissimus TaxID=88925 RepID=UPI002B4F86BA
MAGWVRPLVLLIFIFLDTNGSQLVDTSIGSIQGTSETLDIKTTENVAARTAYLNIYRGIPYGKVTKRFTEPEPADAFTTTFQANDFGNICWNDVDVLSTQRIPVTLDLKAANLTQSEDCLFLNVYVPQNTTGASSTPKRTVVVYIHGGYFSYGAGSDFDGRYLAASQDVITVTFNYRLGALGFLSTGTSASRGNYGLLDQRLALLWVRNNIEYFGGDRDSITLIGHGAGATSAAFHTLSPLSKGLFKRAILASGSAISSVPSFKMADNDNGILQFKDFARDLDCVGDDIFYLDLEKMVECVRNLPVSSPPGSTGVMSLMSKNTPCWYCILDGWPRFRPVVDGYFLPANPSLLLSKRNNTYAYLSTVPFPETDVMFGLSSNEGGRFMIDVKLYASFVFGGTSPEYGIYQNKIDSFLSLAFPYTRYKKDVNDKIKKAVKNEYFTDGNTPIQNRDAAFDVVSDMSFTSGIVANARIHAEVTTTAKTYMYMFDGKSSLTEDYSWNERGANYGDDLPFILGTALVSSENNTYPTSGRPIRQVHRDLSIAMMEHLGNFAKTGDPSSTSAWDGFTMQSQKYHKISTATNSTTMRTTTETNLRQSNVEFWLNDIIELAGDGGVFVEASLPPNRATIYLQPAYSFENVMGLTETFHNGKVHVFRGIPYAKPPVRFEAPTVTRALDFNYNSAEEFSAACPQTVTASLTDLTSDPKIHNRTDEDCLYLNIYVPHNTSKIAAKAVMVYIHGGGFEAGSGASVDGRPLALHGDVIIVTFNYRLGLFGFLSTGDDEARGNWGMLDQHAALQWVKNFVDLFGGDSSRVTIFGSDTGGVSAALHAMSPLSNGLFQRVISQSGAAIDSGAPWRISVGAKHVLAPFTALNQCYGNSTIILNCLRSTAADTLTTQSKIILAVGYKHLFDYGSLLAPVIDNRFILSHPGDESLKFSEVEYMVGFNSNEGTAKFDILPGQFELQQFKHPYPMPEYYYNDMLAGLTLLMPNQKQVIQALKAKYPFEPTDGIATRDNVMKLYGDGLFVAPAYNDALKHYTDMLQTATNTSKRKTFMYEFDQSPSLLVTTPWSAGYGAGHGDEIPYVFGMPIYSKDVISKRGKIVRDVDEQMSRIMMAYWTNFAKTGDPSVGDLPIHTAWSPFTEKDREVLVIGSSETNSTDVHVEVKKNIRWDDAYYWNKYVPYVKEQYCTEPTTTTEGTTVQATTLSLNTTAEAPTTVPRVALTTSDAFSTRGPTLPNTADPTTTNPDPLTTAAPDRPTSTPISKPGPTTKPLKSTQSPPVMNSPPSCPPIGDRQLGNLAIDAKTGESMIIGLAVALCVLFITSIVFIVLYCKARNELNNAPKGHPVYDNPTFTQF